MKTAYINGILLDGTADMTPQEDLVVLTDADTIEDIEFRDNVDLSGYRIVDLDGKYLMPGLINLHVHLPATGKPKKKQPDNVKLVKLMTSNPVLEGIIHRICEETAKTELMSGISSSSLLMKLRYLILPRVGKPQELDMRMVTRGFLICTSPTRSVWLMLISMVSFTRSYSWYPQKPSR